jgi:hypothetical protein
VCNKVFSLISVVVFTLSLASYGTQYPKNNPNMNNNLETPKTVPQSTPPRNNNPTKTSEECTKATEGKYKGQCATAECMDGSYTGANPNLSYTCNHHGGVKRRLN